MKPLETPWQRKWFGLEVTHAQVQAMGTAAEAFCSRWYRNKPHPALLVLCGDSGTGKTQVARAIHGYCGRAGTSAFSARHWGTTKVPGTLFLSWPEAANEFNNKNFSVLTDARENELVILDDVGAENDPWKICADKFCQILSGRENRFTVVTTNLLPTAWAEAFDVRITDRLLRNSVVVDLTGVPSFQLVSPA